jgi:hypothetical protein
MTNATMEAPTMNTTNTTRSTILTRTVCLMLACGRLGKTRKVDTGALDVDVHTGRDAATGEQVTEGLDEAQKEELAARKKLFSKGDLRSCERIVGALMDRLTAMSVDGGVRLFGPGAKLIPVVKLDEAMALVAEHRAALREAVEALVARLPEIVEQRREKLGPLFNAADYPTPDRLRGAFRIHYRFVSFDQPELLMEVAPAVAAAAQAEWEETLREASRDVVAGLRQTAYDVMAELAERLTPGEGEKPKVIRGTALRDLQQFLADLPALNSVAEDGRLAAIVARVGRLAQGLTPDTLRDAPAVREMLRDAAAEASTVLAGLVEESTGRAVMFRRREGVE